MRQLKFKVWDNKTKSWLADGMPMDLNYSGKCNAFMFDNDAFDIPKDVVWVQFTGLKDRNGKEIWEGDVVRVVDDYEKYGHLACEIREIYFLDGSFRFKPKDQSDGRGHLLDESDAFEVLGNIYEHPDLLSPPTTKEKAE